jgi:hypothetical protein
MKELCQTGTGKPRDQAARIFFQWTIRQPARAVFTELLIQMRRAPKYLREAQAEWLSIAEKQLSA